MAKNNELEKKIKFLQDTWKEGFTGLKKSTLEKYGFDVQLSKIEIGNFRLTKDFFFGNYDLEIIDKAKDLDNTLILNNKKAKNHLQSLFRQGITEIHSTELHQFNINTKLGEIVFDNIYLYQIMLSDRYAIDLKDKGRGIDNKIKDENVDFKKVLHALESFKFRKKDYLELTEVQINKKLEDHFKNHFENANKNSPSWKGFFDLEIGNLNFVIEMKKANSLKKSGERQRASGQIKQYLNKVENTNFLMLVFGMENEKYDINVKSLEEEVIKDFGCYFEFKIAE